jgi:hypothetical protein
MVHMCKVVCRMLVMIQRSEHKRQMARTFIVIDIGRLFGIHNLLEKATVFKIMQDTFETALKLGSASMAPSFHEPPKCEINTLNRCPRKHVIHTKK